MLALVPMAVVVGMTAMQVGTATASPSPPFPTPYHCASAGSANAGSLGAVSVSACIQVDSSRTHFRASAFVTVSGVLAIRVAQVTQICSGAGQNCSNLPNSFNYVDQDGAAPPGTTAGTTEIPSTVNVNSFGHKYRNCVMWLVPFTAAGGGCSPARSV